MIWISSDRDRMDFPSQDYTDFRYGNFTEPNRKQTIDRPCVAITHPGFRLMLFLILNSCLLLLLWEFFFNLFHFYVNISLLRLHDFFGCSRVSNYAMRLLSRLSWQTDYTTTLIPKANCMQMTPLSPWLHASSQVVRGAGQGKGIMGVHFVIKCFYSVLKTVALITTSDEDSFKPLIGSGFCRQWRWSRLYGRSGSIPGPVCVLS